MLISDVILILHLHHMFNILLLRLVIIHLYWILRILILLVRLLYCNITGTNGTNGHAK